MELSLFYFAFILLTLLPIADPTKFDIQCPTSRRLLLFGGLNLPIGEKKSHHSSSSSKSSSSSSSPPKYARSNDSHGLIVFIRPQTSNELGHKIRSYTHLLKSKLYTDEEKAKLKRLHIEKKKKLKKKIFNQHKPSITTKNQELVAANNDELNECRALLHVDSATTTTESDKKTKKTKKNKSIKQGVSSKVKNATTQAVKNIKKKVATATTNLPLNNKKVKTTKRNSKADPDEKKTSKISSPSVGKINENRPVTSPVNNIPPKTSPPPPPLQSTVNTKSKRTKPETITIIRETSEPFHTNEDEIDDNNNSVVGRAYHFVKNMFQLSDDSIDDNQTEEDQIIDITNEQQQHHHHSRKLLSIDEHDETSRIIDNDVEFDHCLSKKQLIGTTDDLPFVLTSISKRQLLSVKTNKQSTSSKTTNIKDKKVKSTTNTDVTKPKVGWAYRYRISRYLDAQKTKRTGNKNKQTGGDKTKISQKQKKTNSLTNTKISKRKLLEYHSDDDSSCENDEISDHDIVNSVSITEKFIPKRQLLVSKTKDKHEEDDEGDDVDVDKANTRRRKKSFEELTDPIAIVHSYDHGLYKPRVGWQFRYRISRYIDSLRENIDEDQERLELGLQAIKRKTPQELSGRRKRVLDKPFASDIDELKKQKETIINEQENKPNVGWRYRYRINKMLDAKKHGNYIDDEEEKRKLRLEQQNKETSDNKSLHDDDDDERIEGEDDLDPELRKINNIGRRVGWAYRYRIRRKLNDLKQQEAETGVPFDLATLNGKREKKVSRPKTKSKEKKTTKSTEQNLENKIKSVGWQYRYRVSKMQDAQKPEKSKASTSKKQDQIPAHEQLDPELAQLTPEDRTVGWQYRYRIRRKLNEQTAATRETENGKRAKKSSQTKRKNKEKIMKKVENILNIDDIDETPFMEYFRRTSSYILFGLVPTAKKSLCILPLPMTFSFCNQENNTQITKAVRSKRKRPKKLKTKKEHNAKQFIRSHRTKLGAEDKATERRVDETMKKLYKKPSLPPLQRPPSPPHSEEAHKKQYIHPPKEPRSNEKEEPIIKMIGVESTNKNKKQFQIIGKEIQTKHKHLSPSASVTTPPPTVEVPQSTAPSPLRTISEVIQEEAATILAVRRTSSRTSEEIQAEISETNEIIQEQQKHKLTTTTTTSPTLVDSTTSGKYDNDSIPSSDNNSKADGENVKENLHDTLGL